MAKFAIAHLPTVAQLGGCAHWPWPRTARRRRWWCLPPPPAPASPTCGASAFPSLQLPRLFESSTKDRFGTPGALEHHSGAIPVG